MEKVISTINNILIEDSVLEAKLSKTSWGAVAIYESWAERESKYPYVVLSWRFIPGDHWAKREGYLTCDIFTKGSSSIEAEDIKDRIVELLDKRLFSADESGKIRCYLNNDMIIPDEEPDICHWNIEFSVIYWRKAFIESLIS
ncbi:MAG: hypothetical protein ACTSPI_00635 [Candidatus Heimdallarchaeaceae archaeon]